MANDIHSAIKEIESSKRVSKELKSIAKKLNPFVGTNKDIPKKLKEEVFKNESKSNLLTILKRYVNQKKK